MNWKTLKFLYPQDRWYQLIYRWLHSKTVKFLPQVKQKDISIEDLHYKLVHSGNSTLAPIYSTTGEVLDNPEKIVG